MTEQLNATTIEAILVELKAKLTEARVLAVDLLEFATVGNLLNEALQLVQTATEVAAGPRCMLCDKYVQNAGHATIKESDQYICGECLFDPNRRDEINRLIRASKDERATGAPE